MNNADRDNIVQQLQRWLEQVVIGLRLCPFAEKPWHGQQVRIHVCDASDETALLETLQAELLLLDETPAQELETTLLAIPAMLEKFEDYNQFLELADMLLREFNWQGKYQLASFHPQYRFAGTSADDAENLTNRAPWPLLHIIRETSLTAALEHFPEAENIPRQNIRRMNSLSNEEKQRLFPYLPGNN